MEKDNYRPVSIITVFIKVLETITSEHLMHSSKVF